MFSNVVLKNIKEYKSNDEIKLFLELNPRGCATPSYFFFTLLVNRALMETSHFYLGLFYKKIVIYYTNHTIYFYFHLYSFCYKKLVAYYPHHVIYFR